MRNRAAGGARETAEQDDPDETAPESPSTDDDSADSGDESASEPDEPVASSDEGPDNGDGDGVDEQQTADPRSETEQESDVTDSEANEVETADAAGESDAAGEGKGGAVSPAEETAETTDTEVTETDDTDVSTDVIDDDSGAGSEHDPDAGTDSDTDAAVTLSFDERESGPDADGPLAALGGAIASQSTVAELTGTGAEPTVDGSATMADTEGYGDATAARKDAMFDQGNTLIHSAHDSESTIQMLEFYLNENRYAIEIDRISAIVEMKDITRFPRGPTAIDGVTDLRGEITGVLDPTTMLDVEHNELSDNQYIVVLERDDDKQKLGVRVTDVSQAVTYHDSQIDETGSVMDAAGDHQHECVRGIIKKQDDDDRTTLVAWLDIDELIANID